MRPMSGPVLGSTNIRTLAAGSMEAAAEQTGAISDFFTSAGLEAEASIGLGSVMKAGREFGGIGGSDIWGTEAGQQKITQEEYEEKYAVPGGVFEEGTTRQVAQTKREYSDDKRYREMQISDSPIASFFGAFGGQALDPVNYIPFVGVAGRAYAVAKAGTIIGRTARSGIDAMGNTLAGEILTRDYRQSWGDDVSWQTIMQTTLFAGAIGGTFGAIGGVVHMHKGNRLSQKAVADDMEKVVNAQLKRIIDDGPNETPQDYKVAMKRIAKTVGETMEKANIAGQRVSDEFIANVSETYSAPYRMRAEKLRAQLHEVKGFKNKKTEARYTKATERQQLRGEVADKIIKLDARIAQLKTKLDAGEYKSPKAQRKELDKLTAQRDTLTDAQAKSDKQADRDKDFLGMIHDGEKTDSARMLDDMQRAEQQAVQVDAQLRKDFADLNRYYDTGVMVDSPRWYSHGKKGQEVIAPERLDPLDTSRQAADAQSTSPRAETTPEADKPPEGPTSEDVAMTKANDDWIERKDAEGNDKPLKDIKHEADDPRFENVSPEGRAQADTHLRAKEQATRVHQDFKDTIGRIKDCAVAVVGGIAA